jgi:hypothetical protein
MPITATRAAMLLAGAVLALAATFAPASAQAVRVRGTIEKVDGQTLTVKSREGQGLTIKLADNATVSGVVPRTIDDVKPNSFVGIAALPQPGGTLKALEVLIFPDAMRGAGEGHYAWDLLPESNMTNAAVADIVTKTEGRTLTLKYKDGEKTILVPPETPVVTFLPGERSELVPGAKVFISGAQRQPDGTLTAARVAVGRGITPPM